jgi:3-oxoacyl-[acyl-carrier-protein] synthase-1
MSEVFVVSDNIFSPLGSDTEQNFSRLKNNVSGIKKHELDGISSNAFYASLFDKEESVSIDKRYTRFEQILIHSISGALKNTDIDIANDKTILIISSTKGNISLLETGKDDPQMNARISLNRSAALVADHFGFKNKPVIISNACISGVMGLLTAKRLIDSGYYENAVVTGADLITQFILSGFQSFQAISPEPCKPFDADRKGITLGEGAGTVILSSNTSYAGSGITIVSGSVRNDANHISGPSRTGEPLYNAMNKALLDAGLNGSDIDFISAHGTATLYNDEMEAKAIALAGMEKIPVNSLKGYYGHTLGAAGLIESIISIQSLKENILIPTKGFEKHGVSGSVNVLKEIKKGEYRHCLKTASGFGGCNAAIVISKK